MTAEEAFRFGFLKTCAAEGVGPEAAGRMLKTVETGDAEPVKLAGIGSAIGSLGAVGLPLLALTAVGLPGIAGYAAGRTTNPPFNAADARDEELAETYRQNTERLRLSRMGRQRSVELLPPRVS